MQLAALPSCVESTNPTLPPSPITVELEASHVCEDAFAALGFVIHRASQYTGDRVYLPQMVPFGD
jgi:hypothetical protein